MNLPPPIISILGPTGSGKTNLALKLIKKLPADIISVDSAMIYRGMDIGTAKPTAQELAEAPHRLIDIRDPSEAYSAGDFRRDALIEIADIHGQGRIPLLIGGTMLYHSVLQHGIAELPTVETSIRDSILNEANQLSWPVMHERLKQVDARSASRIHPNDAQRIQRALEVYQATGIPLSVLQERKPDPLPFTFYNLVITTDNRAHLHQRIAERFDTMLDAGFIDEVQQLYQREDLHLGLPSMRSVGYRQVWQYLAGEYDKTTMRERAIAATRQLAKRQITWLNRWPQARRVDSENINLQEIIDWLSQALC